MALINTSLPNLVQGVSQQPATLRFDGQCEEQLNALSSVSDGLKKRPNTQYIKNLISSELDDGAFVHFINRDNNEKYVLIIENHFNTSPEKTTIKVYNILDGSSSHVHSTEITESAANNYLFIPKTGVNAAKPKDVLKALTVGDTTFILNTSKDISRLGAANQKSAPLTADNRAIVFIKKGDFQTEYSVEVTDSGGNTFNAGFISDKPDASNIPNAAVRAGVIANELRGKLAGSTKLGGNVNNASDKFEASVFSAPQRPSISATNVKRGVSGSVSIVGGNNAHPDNFFLITSDESSAFKIKVSDSKSGSALGVIYKEVDSLSDLPVRAPNNFRVKVRGSVEDNEDDYYVKFETNDGSSVGNGGWVEDVGFDEFISFDSNTLPYKLVNSGVNSFSFSASSWTAKQVGDDESNPFPSFFNGTTATGDRKISNIFFYKNRLGLLSEGSVIMSEAGEYFNFFRTTVRSLLDSDPIDINVASKRVTKLSSAVGFQENLILFAERGQFVLRGGELLTPKTVSITPITNYESDTSNTPLELGSYLYFPFTRGNFSGIREFTVNANTDNYDSAEITSHVPQYIPSSILDIAGSTAENLICLVSNKTADDTKDMYVYKYYWEGNQKVLSSWSKFTFPFNIRGIEFVDSDLYIVAAKNDKTELLRMPMEEKLVDDNTSFNTYLDIREAKTVSGGQITLSFTPESSDVVQVYTRESGGTKAGAIIPSTLNGNVLTVSTDYDTKPVWVGIKYTMSYTFSEQIFKQRANRNTSPSGYQRHFLKGGTIFFDDSSSFRVEVTPKARSTYVNTFTSTIIGASTIGTLPIESGSFSFPIMSAAKDTTIKIVNDSALPANFQSAEFESFIHSRSRRV
tara:strand:+ start:4864 stop:7440 length:2577 start_codon:yes stop_codon:yes gene_type:complete